MLDYKTSSLLLAALLLLSKSACSGASGSECTTDTCKVGTTAVTYATKRELYYACPTRELADYTNTILGLVAMEATMGVRPNISDKTGEPEFTGETKTIIDAKRAAAHVTTFDEAVASCSAGKNGRKVIIMNVSENPPLVVWVHDTKSGGNYWMPITSLNKP